MPKYWQKILFKLEGENPALLARGSLLLILTFLALIILAVVLTFKDSPPASSLLDKRINVLLLGVGGGTHEGAQLTDTIILMSINPTRNEVVLVSVPRDFYLADIKGKINSAYILGEEKRKGGGLVLSRAIISKITGQPVDYAVKIDFTGFKAAIDLVGGLDIKIDNSFDDYSYPIAGRENALCGIEQEEAEKKLATQAASLNELFPCRFEHLHFEKGLTHMDGTTALKFVRSRNAKGDEGTDFARSRRQEKVMGAFKNKLLEAGTLFNPFKVISLYRILLANVETDMRLSYLDDFVMLAQKMKDTKIRSAVLDYGDKEKGTSGLLVNPSAYQYDGAWVLVPRVGEDNFLEIQEYVKCEIEQGNCPIP